MTKKAAEALEVSEDILRRMASILGPQSGSAQALANIEKRRSAGQAVRCFMIGNQLVVEGASP